MQKNSSFPIFLIAVFIAGAVTILAGAGYFFGQRAGDGERVETALNADASCSNIATEDQAHSLLTRLFPKASIISAEPLSLDAIKSSCLLEVEMLADAEKPGTRGFVYVLPGGHSFLNGPLMDKRSRVAVEAPSADIEKALEEQNEVIKSIMASGPVAQSQPIQPKPTENEYTNQLAGSFPAPTSTSDIPTVEDMRLRLIAKMESLPSLMTGEGEKIVHVLVDPLCGFCKKLHQDSEELSAKHGIRFNWIPMFLNEGSWAMSALVLKELAVNPERAAELFATMMQGKWAGAEAEAAVRALTEEDYGAVKPAAGLFIELAKTNNRIGTPLVVFKKSRGGVEVISGLPSATDWEGL